MISIRSMAGLAGKAGWIFLFILVNAVWAETDLSLKILSNKDLVLTGEPGTTNFIQYTSALDSTNQWIDLTYVVLTENTLQFPDLTAAGQPTRFYRAYTVLNTNPPPYPDPQYWVWIPAGTFVMGSPTNEVGRSSDEGPQTEVTISRGFWMSKFETTQKEYLAVLGNNPSSFTSDLTRPVESVLWSEANSYCSKLTEQERATGRLPEGLVYRLPTEAEWEYACRAGTTTRFSYGDDLAYSQLGDYAWYGGNSGTNTHPVGLKLPSPWGLYDMYGNVKEWCLDWYGTYLGTPVTDPTGPSSSNDGHVNRGGGWRAAIPSYKTYRSAFRFVSWTTYKSNDVGFRPVLAPALP
jgi:formylglycine-generating enzyme required for sulfatase activity